MNNDEQFEQHLRRQPLRHMPSAWRDEVLAAANAAAGSRPSTLDARPVSWWRELCWPHPAAWAALAGVWLVMLGVQFASREASPQSFARQTPPSPQLRELLKQQVQLFAELVGPRENQEADRPKPVAPQPRSSRREEMLNA